MIDQAEELEVRFPTIVFSESGYDADYEEDSEDEEDWGDTESDFSSLFSDDRSNVGEDDLESPSIYTSLSSPASVTTLPLLSPCGESSCNELPAEEHSKGHSSSTHGSFFKNLALAQDFDGVAPVESPCLEDSCAPNTSLNVCASEHLPEEQTLVAAHDVDGITFSQDMRLGEHNLECNNTSAEFDQNSRAYSRTGVPNDKRAQSISPAPIMPALLAYEDTSSDAKSSKPLWTIGVLSSADVRKSRKAQRRTSRSMSWDVKRISLDCSPVSDVWKIVSSWGEGTYGRVFRMRNKLDKTEVGLKVVDVRGEIPEIVCEALLNELFVLQLLACNEERLPYLLYPTTKRHWAWQSSNGFLHIATVSPNPSPLFSKSCFDLSS